MNPTPDTNTPRVSSSRLAANRRNAKRSTGPKTAPGKQRSAQNACRHGLTRRNAWSGKGQSADGFTQAWARIGPRSPQEEVESANLLQCRADEQMLLAAETAILTRVPIDCVLCEDPFSFLNDTHALAAMDQLSRQIAHQTGKFKKRLTSLLAARARCSGEAVEKPTAPSVGNQPLAELIADRSAIIAGDDVAAFEALARSFWADFKPQNLLEEFAVTDVILSQHRRDRVVLLRQITLSRAAISANDVDCGVGFAFIQDCQRHQALSVLDRYEAALEKRYYSRMALLEKIRAANWQDAVVPAADSPEAAPGGNPQYPAEAVRESAAAVTSATLSTSPMASASQMPVASEEPTPSGGAPVSAAVHTLSNNQTMANQHGETE